LGEERESLGDELFLRLDGQQDIALEARSWSNHDGKTHSQSLVPARDSRKAPLGHLEHERD
jgi:hypothetical protein